MWSTFKRIPLFPKVFVGLLVVVAIVRMSHIYHRPDPSPAYTSYIRENNARQASDEQDTSEASSNRAVSTTDRAGSQTTSQTYGQTTSNAAAANQLLSQFKAQQAQLVSRMTACQQDMNRAAQQMQVDSMNGRMPVPAPCMQYMYGWNAQEAVLESQIYRLQSGDSTSSVSGITGYQAPVSTPFHSSGGSAYGNGREPVADWDRGHMRETSMYTDESGEEHELPTANYYFRNRSTGQMVSSELSDPPNDGRDYERYTNRPQ